MIYQDKQERLWLGTYKNGILLYTPKDGRITRIGDKGSEFLDICSFSEDINGKIWIGTQTGIYSYFNKPIVVRERIKRPVTRYYGTRYHTGQKTENYG